MYVEYRKFTCACLLSSSMARACLSARRTPPPSSLLIFLDIVLSQETIWSSLTTVMWGEVFSGSLGFKTVKNENDCELLPRDSWSSTWVGPECRGVGQGPEPAMHPEEPR